MSDSFRATPPADSLPPVELTAQEVQALLSQSVPPLLLDVRQIEERNFCNLGAGAHIPMGELSLRFTSLPKDRHLIVYCHHGVRSLNATRFLRDHGYPRTSSLRGGIDAWSRTIDPSIPRY